MDAQLSILFNSCAAFTARVSRPRQPYKSVRVVVVLGGEYVCGAVGWVGFVFGWGGMCVGRAWGAGGGGVFVIIV